MSRSNKLIEYQTENKQQTIGKIEMAKHAIEAELQEHGYYPHNNGRITRREICRRAGIGESTLKNRTHSETAEKLNCWLKRIKKAAPTLKPEAEDAKQVRITELTDKLNQIAQHYNRFKLEYNELLHRCEMLEEENASLRRRITEFQSNGIKVISLNLDR
jgi:hypothetical protein